MIDGKSYAQTVKSYFSFLESEFGMKLLEEKAAGNFYYDVRYGDKDKIVSISYENLEDYLLFIVFLLDEGRLPDYDDKTRTLHLAHLNERVMEGVTKNELISNSKYFSVFTPRDQVERKLLKGAKELRLCLSNLKELS